MGKSFGYRNSSHLARSSVLLVPVLIRRLTNRLSAPRTRQKGRFDRERACTEGQRSLSKSMSASPRRITDYSNPCLGCEHPCFKNVTRQKNKAWTRDSRRTFTALLLPSTLELRCCGCWASDLEIHDLLIDAPNQRAASMTKSSRQGSCGFFITSSTRTTRTVGSQNGHQPC